ncbi:MAG: hypothetical protein ACTHU0_21485 [Kofleriaceae bacterium]
MIGTIGLEEIWGYSKEDLAWKKLWRGRGNYVAASTIGPERRRPWVARITGRDAKFGLGREFVEAKRDYSEATGSGKRGVKLWFLLEEGGYFEVCEWLSARRQRRYFVKVVEGYVREVERAEVEAWLDKGGNSVGSSGSSTSTS